MDMKPLSPLELNKPPLRPRVEEPNFTPSRETPSVERDKDALPRTQRVERSREAFDLRFPNEAGIDRFRGAVQGREVREVRAAQSISRLPRQVQSFTANRAESSFIRSLSDAEAAAVGFTPPTQTDRVEPQDRVEPK